MCCIVSPSPKTSPKLPIWKKPFVQAIGPGTNIFELCGGVARATYLAVCRSLRAGPNFDLTTGVDLNDRKDRELTKHYIDKLHILVAAMAPTCGPFGPMGRFVKHVTPDAWQRSYDLVAPHGKFCGVVAQMQLRKGLHFICEQPSGSDLYYEHPWPAVLNHPGVYQQRYDSCMAELKAQYGPFRGTFIKKASTMTASNNIFLEPFEELQCRGNHAHLQMHGGDQNLSAYQVWTWDEADRVAYGIHRPKKSSWHIPQPVYKPILDKRMNDPHEVVIQLHNLYKCVKVSRL